MIEHVGPSYYDTYFKKVDWALKDGRAAAVISASTRPETRYTNYQYVIKAFQEIMKD